jgi:hypothetical protein
MGDWTSQKKVNDCQGKYEPARHRQENATSFLNFVVYSATLDRITEYVGSEFDHWKKPVQTGVLETIHTLYHPIGSIGQTEIEFLIPGDSETYVDTLIKIYVRGKLTKADGTDGDATDHTAFANNSVHTLFSQRNISLNTWAWRRLVTCKISVPTSKRYCSTARMPARLNSPTHTGT